MILHYVIPLLLVGTGFVLARRRTQGAARYCLLVFLGIVFASTLFYFSMNVLRLQGYLSEESYRALTGAASLFLFILDTAGLGLLITYLAFLGRMEGGPTGYGGWLKFYVFTHLYVAP